MPVPLSYLEAVDKARTEATPGELLKRVYRRDDLWHADYWTVPWVDVVPSHPFAHWRISRREVPIGLVATPSQQ